MSSQASLSGRPSPARRPSTTAGGASGAASSGLLASLRARTAGLRDGLEAAGESPASSLGGSFVMTGGGIAGTARTLLDAFSGSGPGGHGILFGRSIARSRGWRIDLYVLALKNRANRNVKGTDWRRSAAAGTATDYEHDVLP